MANRAVEHKWYVVGTAKCTSWTCCLIVACYSVLHGKTATFTPHTLVGDFVIVINAEKLN